jgi:hypothetical protein
MATMKSNQDPMRDGALEAERNAAHPDLERTEPVWPGFRAARLITLMKMRGDARSAAGLALLLIAATAAVLGAAHLDEVTRARGAVLGIGLRASEYPR